MKLYGECTCLYSFWNYNSPETTGSNGHRQTGTKLPLLSVSYEYIYLSWTKLLRSSNCNDIAYVADFVYTPNKILSLAWYFFKFYTQVNVTWETVPLWWCVPSFAKLYPIFYLLKLNGNSVIFLYPRMTHDATKTTQGWYHRRWIGTIMCYPFIWGISRIVQAKSNSGMIAWLI